LRIQHHSQRPQRVKKADRRFSAIIAVV